jgi:hypothetical protein
MTAFNSEMTLEQRGAGDEDRQVKPREPGKQIE